MRAAAGRGRVSFRLRSRLTYATPRSESRLASVMKATTLDNPATLSTCGI